MSWIDTELGGCRFADKRLGRRLVTMITSLTNVIILGKTGVGKTHLAIALGNRICRDANSTFFFSTNLLFEELQAEKVAGSYRKTQAGLPEARGQTYSLPVGAFFEMTSLGKIARVTNYYNLTDWLKQVT